MILYFRCPWKHRWTVDYDTMQGREMRCPACGTTSVEQLHVRDVEWRVGRKLGRTIYAMLDSTTPSDDDLLIGTMDSADLAERIVAEHNAHLDDVPHWIGTRVGDGEPAYAWSISETWRTLLLAALYTYRGQRAGETAELVGTLERMKMDDQKE